MAPTATGTVVVVVVVVDVVEVEVVEVVVDVVAGAEVVVVVNTGKEAAVDVGELDAGVPVGGSGLLPLQPTRTSPTTGTIRKRRIIRCVVSARWQGR